MRDRPSQRGRVHVCIALPNGGSIDEADIALIEAIANFGSILGTSKKIGLSYRKAWLMVDALNRSFEDRVIATSSGGTTSGSRVTDFGHRLVALFRSIERRSNAGAAAAIDELGASLDWRFEAERADRAAASA